jgi:hypothetical protein
MERGFYRGQFQLPTFLYIWSYGGHGTRAAVLTSQRGFAMRREMMMAVRSTFWLCTMAVLGELLSGCALTGGPPGQAQVTIKGRPMAQVQQVTEGVFYRHSFDLKSSWGDRSIFERTGGTAESVLYGNWTGGQTVTRITVYFIDKGPEKTLVRSDARVVRDPHSPFEDESLLYDPTGMKYQGILNKIKAELRREAGE